jgi:hypothetical protein
MSLWRAASSSRPTLFLPTFQQAKKEKKKIKVMLGIHCKFIFAAGELNLARSLHSLGAHEGRRMFPS